MLDEAAAQVLLIGVYVTRKALGQAEPNSVRREDERTVVIERRARGVGQRVDAAAPDEARVARPGRLGGVPEEVRDLGRAVEGRHQLGDRRYVGDCERSAHRFED
jgi:hypothetical protein